MERRNRNGVLLDFSRQLGALVAAGIPLLRALQLIEREAGLPGVRSCARVLAGNLEQGSSLHEAMAGHPGTFPFLYVHLVKVGEETGRLDHVMEVLVAEMENRAVLVGDIRRSLAYPALVGTLAVGVFALTATMVLPVLAQMCRETGVELPSAARMVLGAVAFLERLPLWAGLGLGMAAVGMRVAGPAKVKHAAQRASLAVPLVGTWVQAAETAKVARALGMQLGCGIPLLEALRTTRSVVTNHVTAQALAAVQRAVEEGMAVSHALQAAGSFPSLMVQLVRVGEESGSLDSMLDWLARYYERRLAVLLQAGVRMLEPVLTIAAAVLVGAMAVGLVLPMLQATSGLAW
ncbi:MAG: type II secretion system F family protein [Syntrophomonadaceae bacterium]|jgi:type IV pilus assembly protein PilC|nr:type II secretion system F family protein [Syntrophomonadaceae bacterium]MDH7497796.1 type II secretion system F family protein [Syntrophomonadaceae bacterium]